MKRNFLGWGRNPFKLWQSYLGLLIAGLIPLPFYFRFFSAFWIIYRIALSGISVSSGFLFFILPPISVILAGFFIGAAFKKGKDGFLKYAIIFSILAAVGYAAINSLPPLT